MEDLLPGLSHAPNAHPFFVHFPVVLWPTALAFWLVGVLRGRDGAWRTGTVLACLAVIAAIPTVVTGLAAEEQFHDHDQPWMEKIHVHRNFMLVTSAAAAALAIVAVTRWAKSRRARWILVAALGAVNVLAALGADRGAELVLRHGVGTVPGSETVAPHDL
jgi:uncharacterized membrane protein